MLSKFQQRAAAERVTGGNLMFEVWAHFFIFLILLLCPHTFGHIVSVSCRSDQCSSVLVNPLQQVLGLYLAQWLTWNHTHNNTHNNTHTLDLEVPADCGNVVLETFCLYEALGGWINSLCSEGSTTRLKNPNMKHKWRNINTHVSWLNSCPLCALIYLQSPVWERWCVCVCVCVDLQPLVGR